MFRSDYNSFLFVSPSLESTRPQIFCISPTKTSKAETKSRQMKNHFHVHARGAFSIISIFPGHLEEHLMWRQDQIGTYKSGELILGSDSGSRVKVKG